MALTLRRKSSRQVQLLSTLIAVFSLVMQPMYAVIDGAVASAVSANVDNVVFAPTTTAIDAGTEKTFKLEFRHGSSDEALDGAATVELSTSSATGEFADGTSAANPWSHAPTYTTSASASKTFRYKDTTAGVYTLTAHVSGGGLSDTLDASATVTVKTSTPATYSYSVSVAAPGSFQAGTATDFSVTTSTTDPADDASPMVRAYFTDGAANGTYEYKDGSNSYQPFSGATGFGPSDGFEFRDGATSFFRATYPTAGNFTSHLEFREVGTGDIVAQKEINFTVTPPPTVCDYDFAAQKMWEVTWGYDFAHRNGGAPKFTMQSSGGLTSLNGGPVPSYMTANWHWLYITEGQATRHYDYGFADGTVRTADITFSNINGCQVPEITWGVKTASTTFVNDPKYVRENNSNDLVAQLVTPDTTQDVRFFVDGDTTHPFAGSNVGGAGANTSWWRLKTPLTGGEHTISAQVKVGDDWYDVSDTAVVYSIDAPTAEYVVPHNSQYFRPNDLVVRVKADDEFNQFDRMVTTINGSTYTVNRVDCNDKGNYVLCDLKGLNLADGTYTATTTTYTKANNRVDDLVSRSFVIDNFPPRVVFNAPSLFSPPTNGFYGDSLMVETLVDDGGLSGIDDVKLYATEPRADGQCDPNEAAVLGPIDAEPTLAPYFYLTSVDTSSLNGKYCFFAVAGDKAGNHSDPQMGKFMAEFDNTDPVVDSITVKDAGGITRSAKDAMVRGTATFHVEQTEANPKRMYVEYDQMGSDGKWHKRADTEALVSNHADLVVNTKNWASGTYQIKVSTDDLALHHGGKAVTFTVDNDRPEVRVTTPTAGNLLKDTVTVSGTATDSLTDVQDGRVELQLRKPNMDGTKCGGNVDPVFYAAVDATGHWSTTFDSNDYADGKYCLNVIAYDGAGNQNGNGGTQVKFVTIDNTAPTAPVASTQGWQKTHDVIFKWTASSDDHAVTYKIVYNDNNSKDSNGNLKNITTLQSGLTGTSYDATSLSDGPYFWQVIATDAAGNVSYSNIATMIIDTQPPVITIAPDSGTLTGTKVINVNVSDTYLKDKTVVFTDKNGNVVSPVSVNGDDYTINTTTLPDGNFKVSVTATDVVGNSTLEEAVFMLDNTGPAVTIDEPAAINSGDPLMLTGTVTDAASMLTVTIDDVAQTGVVMNGKAWSLAVDTSALTVGDHTITALATDAYGNVGAATSATLVVNKPDTIGGGIPEAPLLPDGNGMGGLLGRPDSTAQRNALVSYGAQTPTDPAEEKDTGVLGIKDDNAIAPLDDTAAVVAPSSEGWKIFGMAWYWWLLILAVIAGILWAIAGARRRSAAE